VDPTWRNPIGSLDSPLAPSAKSIAELCSTASSLPPKPSQNPQKKVHFITKEIQNEKNQVKVKKMAVVGLSSAFSPLR
jgi:hypothetical protein